ncbi:MAG: hypothetical protein ABW186_05825 [Rhodanobacteraceae bacterium]
MRDEASLARLEEMGFAVYVPRGVRHEAPAAASPQTAMHPREARTPPLARVVLLAREESKAARAFVAGVRRALAFARIDGDVATAIDEQRLGDAKGLVAFGDAFAREVGIHVSATRQAALAWVATADAEAIAGQALAKRALWSELKRLARAVRAGTA